MTNTTSKETDKEIAMRVLLQVNEPDASKAIMPLVCDIHEVALRLLAATKRIAELEAVVNRPVTEIKRYIPEFVSDGSANELFVGMAENAAGHWVSHDDHLTAMRGREASTDAALVTSGQQWMQGQSASIAEYLKQKCVCYGIFASDGEMFLNEEGCVADAKIELDGWLDELQETQPDRKWKILPMIPLREPSLTLDQYLDTAARGPTPPGATNDE